MNNAKSVIPVTLVLVGLLLAVQPAARGQTSRPLFAHLPADATKLLAAEEANLQKLYGNPLNAEISVVRVDLELLRTVDGFFVPLEPGDRAAAAGLRPFFVIDRIEERTAEDYSWFGVSEDPRSQAILVVRGTEVVGTIHHAGELYSVRPLGGGRHALIRVDLFAVSEDHPPECGEIAGKLAATSRENEMTDKVGELYQDPCYEITVLVAYTPAAEGESVGDIEQRIQLAVDETNLSYANSDITPRLKLVHVYRTSYTESGSMETDRDNFQSADDIYMPEVHDLRDMHRADVAILVTRNDPHLGGVATGHILAPDATWAFAVVAQGSVTALAHETGHLQGARHEPEADSHTSPFAYGHGYRYLPDGWHTVMSTNPGGFSSIPHWSNPNVSYGIVPTGTAATHDNARVLNETACHVANFLPAARGLTISGSSSDLDRYISPYGFVLPGNIEPADVVAVAIAGSNDHVYAWYLDGTVSSGTTHDFAWYRRRYSYSLPSGKTPNDIVGIGIAGSNDRVYTWYRDATVSIGSSNDLDRYRRPRAYSLPSGKTPNDIVGIGVAGSNDHVYAWYLDGTVSSGYSRDLDYYRSPYSYSPEPVSNRVFLGVAIAGSNDHVYAFYHQPLPM